MLAVPLLVLLPSAAFAQDYYGAIAYSPGKKAHGWASNHPSRAAAQRTALENCRKYAPDCKTVVWFLNACATLATGEAGYGSAWGSTQAAADKEAELVCAFAQLIRQTSCVVQYGVYFLSSCRLWSPL